ncbi:caspase family protein [Streptomyces sp. G44]|uniref:caspase family protein n=1 Tax=Streptomyces sp. G44 TaxID=2807632 RepID=UPI00195F8C0A|nr:caspase family protein [Streptomyces sp. G44]MBM7169447.1 caspase family protein [Streptomyces sp. G44]
MRSSEPTEADRGEPRRFVIAAGTGNYSAPEIEDLPGVHDDVELIASLFASLGYERALRERSRNPSAKELVAGLEEWLGAPERRPDDIVVLYYAGHGVRASGGRHYLLCSDSVANRLVSTAIRTDDLALMFADDAVRARVLLVLDTCYAGAGTTDIAVVANQLATARTTEAGNLWLLAGARARDQAVDGALTGALAGTLAAPRAGAHQQYIDLSEITERINDHFREHHPHQHASCTSVDTAGVPPFFPNRNFVPGLFGGELDVETLTRMRRERATHFDLRARGVEYVGETGSYFTGRVAALTALARWLAQPSHDRRARVVTGGPGSGKSALLGRLLHLSDKPVADARTPPETVPPTGCVTAHLHLRHRTLDDVVSELGRAAGCVAATPDDLLGFLLDRSLRFTVLLDALDEAGTVGDQAEATLIARALLRPMSTMAQVRLVVGTRRGPIEALGTAVEIIDLDQPAYTRLEDVADYVRALLLAEDDPDSLSPYRGHTALATTVARGVAVRAGQSFLVANMTARALINRQVQVDTSQVGWHRRLPSEVKDVFAAYLSRFGVNEWRVRRLLTPLAYAEGQGLPWDNLWAALATVLAGVRCSDEDINWLLGHAGAYIVEVRVGDRSVFRLYHETLAEFLRDSRRDTEAHRRITTTLLDQVPSSGVRRTWAGAHPYIRGHVASHAAIAGTLDELLSDPEFLVHADPVTLVPALRRVSTEQARTVRSVYRSSLRLHRRSGPMTRRQILAFDAASHQARDLAADLSAGLPWRVRWATGSQVNPALQMSFGDHSHGVKSADCFELEAQPYVVTADTDGLLRLWDLGNGNLHGVLRGHMAEVNSVHHLRFAGEPLAISASSDGTVRVWSLRNESERALLRGHVGRVGVATGAVVSGRLTLVSGGDDRTIRLWDFATGQERQLLAGHTGAVRALAYAEVDGRPKLASGGSDGSVRLWDLPGTAGPASERTARRQVGHEVLRGHSGEVNAVAFAELDGEPVLISGGDDRTVRMWDLRRLKQKCVFSGDMGWVRAVSCLTLDGRSVVVCGTDSGHAHIWDLRREVELGVLIGHTHWVRAVAGVEIEGRTAVVTGASDGTICVWDPRVEVQTDVVGHAGGVNAVSAVSPDGHALAVSGGDDRTVRTWDIESGRQHAVIAGHTGFVRAVACARLGETTVVVSGASDGTIRVWDLASRRQRAVLTGHTDWVSSVACTQIRGNPVAVSAGDDCTLRIWDLRTHGERDILTGHTGGVNTVACTSLDGRPIALSGSFDGSIRLWDLETGRASAVLTGHTGWVRDLDCGTLHGRPVVVSVDDDGGVFVWDLKSRTRPVRLSDAGAGTNAIAYMRLRNRAVVVTAGDDRIVRFWDLHTRERREGFVLPAPGWSLAAAPDNRLVVGTGREVCVFDHHGDGTPAAGSATSRSSC